MCCVAVFSHSVMSDSLRLHGLQPAKLLCPWGFSRQEYQSGLPCPPPGDLSNPGIKPRSLALKVDSLPFEPPGKTKNTGMGSLSFLQGNFLTQESNRVSCIAGGFFTSSATRKALRSHTKCKNPTSQHILQGTICTISQCCLYHITPGIAGHMRTYAV